MPELLSPAWVAALDAAARAAPPPPGGVEAPLVLEVRVGDAAAPGEAGRAGPVPQARQVPEAVHHLVVGPDGMRVRPGPAAAPDVVLVTDRHVAAALARGETSAQEALAAGRLLLRGRPQALAGREAVLRDLAAGLRAARASTTLGPADPPSPSRRP